MRGSKTSSKMFELRLRRDHALRMYAWGKMRHVWGDACLGKDGRVLIALGSIEGTAIEANIFIPIVYETD